MICRRQKNNGTAASSVGGSTTIAVGSTSGLSIPNDTKLILLKNTAITPERFMYSDPEQIFKKNTLDGSTYLTLRDAPYPSPLTQTPVTPITYGQSATLPVTARRSSTSEALTGNINFYKGITATANTGVPNGLAAKQSVSGRKSSHLRSVCSDCFATAP